MNNPNLDISMRDNAYPFGLGDGTISSDQVLLVWRYAQALTSPELIKRKEGFQRLIELNIINKSPLLTYILATRIKEVDINLRAYIVNVLANILELNIGGDEDIQLTKYTLVEYLSQLEKQEIHALIQLVEVDPYSNENIVRIMCSSSCAGDYLKGIAFDRQESINIRQVAIMLLGQIGYLDTISDLERLESRIINRTKPNSTGSEEKQLLPQIADALSLLRAP